MKPLPTDPEERVFTFIVTWGVALIVGVVWWNW
jgi:hypothetical protein